MAFKSKSLWVLGDWSALIFVCCNVKGRRPRHTTAQCTLLRFENISSGEIYLPCPQFYEQSVYKPTIYFTIKIKILHVSLFWTKKVQFKGKIQIFLISAKMYSIIEYGKRTIITCGFVYFYPLLEAKKGFFKELFS